MSAPSTLHPWRAIDDAPIRGFVYDSVTRRLADIVAKVDAPSAKRFSQGLRDGSYLIEDLDDSDGGPDWTTFILSEVEANGGHRDAFHVGWFFLENYAYRKLLGDLGYFKDGCDARGRDPFAEDKRGALDAGAETFLSRCREVALPNETFSELVKFALWGNRGDLSLSAGKLEHGSAKHAEGSMLLDDSQRCWDVITTSFSPDAAGKGTVVVVLDNCGAELLADLRFASFLIHRGYSVEFHAKPYPVFVSDAMVTDVEDHVEWIRSHAPDLGKILQRALQQKTLRVSSHPFYATPTFFKDAPPDLVKEYEAATLVVTKGDANYRRLIEDTPWPPETPFASVVGLKRVNLLAVRTCKAPVAVGLTREIVAEASKSNPKWCLDGSSGMVQFVGKDKS